MSRPEDSSAADLLVELGRLQAQQTAMEERSAALEARVVELKVKAMTSHAGRAEKAMPSLRALVAFMRSFKRAHEQFMAQMESSIDQYESELRDIST